MLQNGCKRYSLNLPSCRYLQATSSLRKTFFLRCQLHPFAQVRNRWSFTSTTSRYRPNSNPQLRSVAAENVGFDNDTIYALSTGVGARAGIAIVRISGPSCLHIYNALCPSKPPLKPRYASVRMLHDPLDNAIILDSSALTIYFPGPKTVTGEDVLELHVHGGPATVKAVLAAIPKCASHTRMAEPGEFTRRAFENGRLDLAQVEALSDTLAAETEQQRRAAVRGHSRKLGRTYDAWREQLTYARGELEALIDFSEDQHFDESPAELLSNVASQVRDMVGSISKHEFASHRGDLLRRGVEIALIGPPNAGKSSLLNLIVGREASIVSSEAGTTRDVVEVRYDIGGYLCTFADTAGLRTSTPRADSANQYGSSIVGDIEQEGIRRAKARAEESDLVVILVSVEPMGEEWAFKFGPGSLETTLSNNEGKQWAFNFDADSMGAILSNSVESPKPVLIVLNKCDSITVGSLDIIVDQFADYLGQSFGFRPPPILPISCLEAMLPSNVEQEDPGNIQAFTRQLKMAISSMTDIPAGSEDLLGVTERQRQLLTACKEHLTAFLLEANKNQDPSQEEDVETDIVIAAEHLRSAADCLSRITGRGLAGDVEEVLGVVFEKFCVGK